MTLPQFQSIRLDSEDIKGVRWPKRILSPAGDASQILLDTLNNITQPHRSQASSLALGILRAVQQRHSNEPDFIALAETVCKLVIDIDEHYSLFEIIRHSRQKQNLGSIESEPGPLYSEMNSDNALDLMNEHLKKISCTLLEIEQFACRKKDIKWFKFIQTTKHKSGATQIEEFRRKLDRTTDDFMCVAPLAGYLIMDKVSLSELESFFKNQQNLRSTMAMHYDTRNQ
ncbi:hypothetical protein WG66_001040 [Moniliophthora roreri]|uniref:Uncharacterized protein n=1 Tax=Moniliophthora roreri TaxID=221103 RepID=A0A0W0FJ60_MONRR|nr:hypothetical protein WG66_001040 [Moniliophthora roreri]